MEDHDMMQIHVVRDWHYLGSASTTTKARRLDDVVEGFDNDGYRILVKPLLARSHEVILF